MLLMVEIVMVLVRLVVQLAEVVMNAQKAFVLLELTGMDLNAMIVATVYKHKMIVHVVHHTTVVVCVVAQLLLVHVRPAKMKA